MHCTYLKRHISFAWCEIKCEVDPWKVENCIDTELAKYSLQTNRHLLLHNTSAGMLETWKPGIPETKVWNPKTRNDFFSDDKRS